MQQRSRAKLLIFDIRLWAPPLRGFVAM